MATFNKIVDHGTGPIAEFDKGYVWDEDRYFYLNKDSVITRISNMERDGRDTSQERLGLKALEAL